MEPIQLITTTKTRKEAEEIAKILLEKKLVACAQIGEGIESFYWWKGEIESSREVVLSVKTTKAKFSEVEKAIQEVHTYEVPEIIALPIVNMSDDYRDWMIKELS